MSEHRLEVIDSGSGERLYSAMRDQAERGREFRARVRWMWLRRDLMEATEQAVEDAPDVPVIDLRDGQPISSTPELPGSRQEDSA